MNNLLFVILFVIAIILIFNYQSKNKVEGYNDQVGKLCVTCSGKPFNQCLNCFNCGFCIDKSGNGHCVPGDHTGPFNYEKCSTWIDRKPSTCSCNNYEDYLWYDKESPVYQKARMDGVIRENSCKPYSKDKNCVHDFKWYYGDPYAKMMQDNSNYGCSGCRTTNSITHM